MVLLTKQKSRLKLRWMLRYFKLYHSAVMSAYENQCSMYVAVPISGPSSPAGTLEQLPAGDVLHRCPLKLPQAPSFPHLVIYLCVKCVCFRNIPRDRICLIRLCIIWIWWRLITLVCSSWTQSRLRWVVLNKRSHACVCACGSDLFFYKLQLLDQKWEMECVSVKQLLNINQNNRIFFSSVLRAIKNSLSCSPSLPPTVTPNPPMLFFTFPYVFSTG